jgi:glycosyltransferase involved in cell wall biosynthesis
MAVRITDELRARGLDASLTWVGDYSPDLQDVYDFPEFPYVRRLAWRDDWLSLADEETVVLLSSGVEGLGNVLIEASAARIPCVAGSTALGCADALVTGVTGYLAVSDTPADYANAVELASLLNVGSEPIEAWAAQFSFARTASVLTAIILRAARLAPLLDKEKTSG